MSQPAVAPATDPRALPEPTLFPPELPIVALEERARRYPLGASVTRQVLEDGTDSSIWHQLRNEEPVTWCPAVGGWLVTKRAWGAEVFRAPEQFTVFSAFNILRRALGEQMLSCDGERHERQRKPFEPPLKARPVRENYAELVRRQATAAIDRVDDAAQLDVGAWASAFAIATIAEVLGLGEKRPEELRQIYDAFASAMSYGLADEAERMRAAHEAKHRLADLLIADLKRVRAQPDGSIISHMAEQEGRGGLDTFTVIQNVAVILFGAIETVESMVSNTLWLLLRHPDALEDVRNDRSLVANAVEESLRLVPPVGVAERCATVDANFHGAELLAGEMILPIMIALNRDPETFPEPDDYVVRRENARAHYSLAHGKHFCLGANLARLQGEAVVNAFLDAFPNMALGDASGGPAGFELRRVTPLYLQLRG